MIFDKEFIDKITEIKRKDEIDRLFINEFGDRIIVGGKQSPSEYLKLWNEFFTKHPEFDNQKGEKMSEEKSLIEQLADKYEDVILKLNHELLSDKIAVIPVEVAFYKEKNKFISEITNLILSCVPKEMKANGVMDSELSFKSAFNTAIREVLENLAKIGIERKG